MRELSNSEVKLVSGAGLVTANINSNSGIGAIIHIPSFQEWGHNQLNGSEANINEFGINVNELLR